MTRENLHERGGISRRILRLTIPTVVSNISVPLLGLCDTAVTGHMGDERYLAAIAIGSVMISTVYWLFSFLRGGTSGLTATAYGAKDEEWMGESLMRSSILGVAVGIILIAVHVPVMRLLSLAMGASPQVTALASTYFSICIWGAVPMMILMSITGWFIGMQATDKAMWVNIGVSLLNVVFTLTLVYGCGLGFKGIAIGTLAAQWVMLIPALVLALRLCSRHNIKLRINRRLFSDFAKWREIFNVNSNLFFRSACLIGATMMLYAFSARMGDVVTGANAVINQLFLFFSYFMDGFAYTGEALVGRYHGAKDGRMLAVSVRALLWWSAGVTLLFVALYGAGLQSIVWLLSDSAAVEGSVMACRVWVLAIPVAGAAAFIYDGFYIGLTKTRPMLVSTVCGVALFVSLLLVVERSPWMLWMAFTCYLALRSAILVILFPRASGIRTKKSEAGQ